MSSLSPIYPADYYHTEIRQTIGGNRLDQPTAGEKFKMVFAKIGSTLGGFFGSIGRSLGIFGGPFAALGTAVSYGVKGISDRYIGNVQVRKQQEAAIDSQASALMAQGPNFSTPGFTYGSEAVPNPTIDWAPYSRPYQSEITGTLLNKGAAASDAVTQMQTSATL